MRQPRADGRRVVVNDVEEPGGVPFDGQDRGARRVVDVHPRRVAAATPDHREEPSADQCDLLRVRARAVERAIAQNGSAGAEDLFLESSDRSGPFGVLEWVFLGLDPSARTGPVPELAWLSETTCPTPDAPAAVSRWSRPSLRRRLVTAKNRPALLRGLGLPVYRADKPVIWLTTVSGAAAATASPTDIASRPSMTTASAPMRRSVSSLAGSVVVAVT